MVNLDSFPDQTDTELVMAAAKHLQALWANGVAKATGKNLATSRIRDADGRAGFRQLPREHQPRPTRMRQPRRGQRGRSRGGQANRR